MTSKKHKPSLPREIPRVSDTERVILQLLADHDELYGLEMIARSPALKRGTIYVTLDRLEDKKLVSSREVAPPPGARGPSRRIYRLTGVGSHVLEAQRVAAVAWNSFLSEGAT